MKLKTILASLVLLFAGAVIAQPLTKLFDVRGSGATTTTIEYRDANAKDAVIDALCDQGNYDALDPATRPTKQAFANREIQFWLRDKVKASREKAEQKKIVAPDVSDLP